MKTSDSKTINSVGRSLEIIRALNELDGARIDELASYLGFSKGSVHAHLSTWREHDYVTNEGGTYRLGLEFFSLGMDVKRSREVIQIVEPHVTELASMTDENVSFIMEEHGKGIFVSRKSGSHELKTGQVGQSVPLHCTAAGKAILAFRPESEVKQILSVSDLEPKTENTITEEDTLLEELEEIRERGVSFNMGERISQLRSVSVPIKKPSNYAIGALVITGPHHRMDEERLRSNMSEILLGRADEIELNISYH